MVLQGSWAPRDRRNNVEHVVVHAATSKPSAGGAVRGPRRYTLRVTGRGLYSSTFQLNLSRF